MADSVCGLCLVVGVKLIFFAFMMKQAVVNVRVCFLLAVFVQMVSFVYLFAQFENSSLKFVLAQRKLMTCRGDVLFRTICTYW